jgi:DNA-binding Lrp family transcriptional regulator
MDSYQYQRQKKQESEERIINALGGKELRFTELLKKTGLSKPVLNAHIKRLRKEGKIKRIKPKNKRPRYKLLAGALKYGYIRRILFSVLSTQIFNDVFEATGKGAWSDEEFVRRFSQKIGGLAIFVLYLGLSIGIDDPEEGGKWIEDAFGTLFQKYAWRRCFFRQIFGGGYDLRTPILLKEPVSPELRGDLVKLPEAFIPGLSSKILSKMPNIPHNRMEAFKRLLDEIFPEEMERLNEIITLIENGSEVNS